MSLFLLHFSCLFKRICTCWAGSWDIPAMPTTGHASGVNVTADTWCTAFLEEERIIQKFSSSLCHVTAVLQRCHTRHTRELWEWWQHCWKSCTRAFHRSLQPGVETWCLSRSLKTSAPAGSCAGDCSCRLALGHSGEMSRPGFLYSCWVLVVIQLPLASGREPGAGHRQPVLHGSAAPSGWARWSAGLQRQLRGDCGCWFSSPVTPCGLWVKHN